VLRVDAVEKGFAFRGVADIDPQRRARMPIIRQRDHSRQLVGREEESELLLRRWPKAKTGEGQVILLSGEAGIGKSRLTAAFLQRLAGEPHTRLRYFCSPQHSDTALYPIIRQIGRAAGLAHDDSLQVKLDKLDAMLAQTSTSMEDAALHCRDAFAAERWTLSRARTEF
jgi:hypothetical protein